MEQTVLLACLASTWFMTGFPPSVWSAPTSCALLPGRSIAWSCWSWSAGWAVSI